MKYCEVGIYHHDCWFTNTISKFPDAQIKEITSRTINSNDSKRTVKAFWELLLENSLNLNDIVDYISRNKSVTSVKSLVTQNNRAILEVVWKSPKTSYDVAFNSGCDFISQCYSKEGYETYSIINDDPNTIKNMLNEFKEIGDTKIFSIQNNNVINNNLNFGLTDKQKENIKQAISYGYYDWPKKTNLETLANKTNKNRRTLQDSLRTAEKKVFSKLLQNL